MDWAQLQPLTNHRNPTINGQRIKTSNISSQSADNTSSTTDLSHCPSSSSSLSSSSQASQPTTREVSRPSILQLIPQCVLDAAVMSPPCNSKNKNYNSNNNSSSNSNNSNNSSNNNRSNNNNSSCNMRNGSSSNMSNGSSISSSNSSGSSDSSSSCSSSFYTDLSNLTGSRLSEPELVEMLDEWTNDSHPLPLHHDFLYTPFSIASPIFSSQCSPSNTSSSVFSSQYSSSTLDHQVGFTRGGFSCLYSGGSTYSLDGSVSLSPLHSSSSSSSPSSSLSSSSLSSSSFSAYEPIGDERSAGKTNTF